jgi:hypothetical protein
VHASKSISGFRRKPLWIYVVSAIFIFSPFINFAFSLKGRGEPGWLSPQVWMEWLPHTPPRSFAVSVLLFLTGILLLYVNKWSWRLAIVSLIVLSGYNLLLIRGIVVNNFSILTIVSMMMGGFIFLLYQSEFRDVFINPRLRWWESKPRFAVDKEVGLRGHKGTFHLVDLSKSGFQISTRSKSADLQRDHRIEIEIAEGVTIPGVVVRIEKEGATTLFGIRIENIGRYESRYLYGWIRVLQKSEKKIR